ncbi:MAG: acyl-CoA dehydrogenase family protein [Deltaproteobacteria bacterium]|nr:acyl-CoA dehydrogenase family protein [Deltaproteobacteria bacterium]
MDFSPPPTTLELVARYRAFVDEELLALEPLVFSKPFGDSLPTLTKARVAAKARGLWAPAIPKEHGGLGLSLVELAFVGEALGGCPIGHWAVNFQPPDAGNLELLHLFGTPDQQEQFMKPVVDGAARSCFAMTEPERPGSNPTWLETTAKNDGTHWVINGHKWFTSGADGAAFAIVMASTHEDGKAHERASMILVPMSTPGVTLVRNLPVMGEAGSDWASHGEVRFVDVKVPLANLLGQERRGFALAQERLGPGRIHHCMRWLGICQRAFELMMKRAVERPVAPFRALGHQQMVQRFIAESAIAIEAARWLVLKTAWVIDTQGQKAARDDVAMIKVLVARTLQDVLDRAIQVHGGLGLLDDLPLAWFFRHERAARIYDGPDEVHLASIAKRLLSARGLPSST